MAARNPAGTEIIAGFVHGNNGSPTKNAAPSTGLITLGLNATRTSATIKPVNIEATAPVVLNRFQ